MIQRPWAFWRRVQYSTGVGVVLSVFLIFGFFSFLYSSPSCFDGRKNGEETGIDCGGACSLVCASETLAPIVSWAKAFRIADGRYNAVAYIENRNATFGTNEFLYTFSLYDNGGEVITTVSGVTSIPPDGVYPIFAGPINTENREVVRTFLAFEPVTNWSIMSTGREQFEIQSRVLTGADSAPRLTAEVFNTTLEDVRDVEIVTTIFDVRGNALTASKSVVPVFRGRETQKVVFTWPNPIAKTLRSCEVPSDVVLAIDLSGSMNDDGGTPPEPVTSTLNAAKAFVDRLGQGDLVGLVTYATDAVLNTKLSAGRDGVIGTIGKLRITAEAEVGATNTGDAINYAREELLSLRHNQDARKVLILLTDGKATAPGTDPESYARTAAIKAKENDITVFTIGLGGSVNEAFLTEIASSKDHVYFAADAKSIDTIYRSVSTALCEEGAAVIDVVAKPLPDILNRTR